MKPPRGRSGRPSKSFTLDQAKALLATAETTRWHAYVALSLLVGIRTEEARALRWDHIVTWVDDASGWQPVTTAGFDATGPGDDRYAIYVWRSDREGSDTKTEKSRQTLALPRLCVEALCQRHEQQERGRLMAGELWQEHGLVFALQGRHAPEREQCHPGVPDPRQELRRPRRGLGAPGDEAHLRVGPVRQRRPRGGHRPATSLIGV